MAKSTSSKGQADAGAFDEQIINSMLINGDMSKLTQQQKVDYYRTFCERLGLDPLTQPFKLLRLNGKEILYCDRTGAQQLNKLHKVSHEIRARETVSGCYVVTAQASLPEGRHTESIGAVTIDNLRGDSLCNAMMKAETKAKRRATLDLLGLGILDESETETIPNAQTAAAPVAPQNTAGSTPPPVPPQSNTAPPATGNATDPKAAPQVSPFKKKYDTVEELSKVVETAKEVKDVANLYYINAEMVEGNADLKAKFTGKKNEIYGGGGSIAA